MQFFSKKYIFTGVALCVIFMGFSSYIFFTAYGKKEVMQLENKEREQFMQSIEKLTSTLISPSAEIFTQEEEIGRAHV